MVVPAYELKIASPWTAPKHCIFFQHLSPAPQMNLSFYMCHLAVSIAGDHGFNGSHCSATLTNSHSSVLSASPGAWRPTCGNSRTLELDEGPQPLLSTAQPLHGRKLRPGGEHLKGYEMAGFPVLNPVCAPRQHQWAPKALACWPQSLRKVWCSIIGELFSNPGLKPVSHSL